MFNYVQISKIPSKEEQEKEGTGIGFGESALQGDRSRMSRRIVPLSIG